MYAVKNFRTKKELKEAVAAGDVPVFQPGGMFPTKAGPTCVEGPHYPEPHKWYASATVVEKDGQFVIAQGSKVS